MNSVISLMLTVSLVAGSPVTVEVPPAERKPVTHTYQIIKDWLGCSKGQTHPWCSK